MGKSLFPEKWAFHKTEQTTGWKTIVRAIELNNRVMRDVAYPSNHHHHLFPTA